MQFKEKKRRRTMINITSLIDVLFILLIFFMVSSSFIEQPGMKLELPTIQSKEVARLENLVIHISEDEVIFLGDKQVSLENLGSEIENMIPNIKEKTLVLKADKKAEHGFIVQIMDIAKRSGLTKIVIGTRVEGEQ
ncbi:biopolymer transporter ExbD [candidate division KSB1 bacterium]|nr:biopolymer transporter ExbD [candidate division KSB1 bacterium]RQW06078.1 MAG: biopolymer transporter ExbD [candidate division KSB1 bacterium]